MVRALVFRYGTLKVIEEATAAEIIGRAETPEGCFGEGEFSIVAIYDIETGRTLLDRGLRDVVENVRTQMRLALEPIVRNVYSADDEYMGTVEAPGVREAHKNQEITLQRVNVLRSFGLGMWE